MENDELTARAALIRPLFEIVKGVVEVQGKHQSLLEGLLKSYSGLLAVLSGTGEPDAPPTRSVAQDAAIAKAQAEIAELETLFEREQAEGESL